MAALHFDFSLSANASAASLASLASSSFCVFSSFHWCNSVAWKDTNQILCWVQIRRQLCHTQVSTNYDECSELCTSLPGSGLTMRLPRFPVSLMRILDTTSQDL